MKKMLTMMMTVILALALLAGCGSNNGGGSVATDGSTSMEKVIGALGEAFQNDTGISFTYNPTGSGSGIKAVQEGRCDIGLSSRDLKDEEKGLYVNSWGRAKEDLKNRSEGGAMKDPVSEVIEVANAK